MLLICIRRVLRIWARRLVCGWDDLQHMVRALITCLMFNALREKEQQIAVLWRAAIAWQRFHLQGLRAAVHCQLFMWVVRIS